MVLNTRRILEKGSRMTTTTRIMMITIIIIIIIMIIKKPIGSFFSSIYSIKSNVLNGYDGTASIAAGLARFTRKRSAFSP